jgi:hypothetical protein
LTAFDYDGRTFRPDGDTGTQATYHQDADLVWGEFAGGHVRRGSLTGTCDQDGVVTFAYTMVLDSGALITGRCRSTPQVLGDGRIRFTEDWERYLPTHETGVSYLEEVPAADGRRAAAP